MKRTTLLLIAVFLGGPTFAQDASQDPCALTLFHLDRMSESHSAEEKLYRQDILSMIALAGVSIGIDETEALSQVRFNCALNPISPFIETVAEVIDAGHRAEIDALNQNFDYELDQLHAEVTMLKLAVRNADSDDADRMRQELEIAKDRSTSLTESLLNEREIVIRLRARISELLAAQ